MGRNDSSDGQQGERCIASLHRSKTSSKNLKSIPALFFRRKTQTSLTIIEPPLSLTGHTRQRQGQDTTRPFSKRGTKGDDSDDRGPCQRQDGINDHRGGAPTHGISNAPCLGLLFLLSFFLSFFFLACLLAFLLFHRLLPVSSLRGERSHCSSGRLACPKAFLCLSTRASCMVKKKLHDFALNF